MIAIALVSIINHNHINGVHLFCDALYIEQKMISNFFINSYQIQFSLYREKEKLFCVNVFICYKNNIFYLYLNV